MFSSGVVSLSGFYVFFGGGGLKSVGVLRPTQHSNFRRPYQNKVNTKLSLCFGDSIPKTRGGRDRTVAAAPAANHRRQPGRKHRKEKTVRLMAKTINSTQSQFEASSSPCRQTFGAITNSFSDDSIFSPDLLWNLAFVGKEVSGHVAGVIPYRYHPLSVS